MTWLEIHGVSLKKRVKICWPVPLRLTGVQTLQILVILLFLFKLSMKIGLIKLAGNERKNMWL